MITASQNYRDKIVQRIVKLGVEAKISWSKAVNPSLTWFRLDESRLDGSAMLAPLDDNPTQIWDLYEYEDLSEKIISISIERGFEFPYQVQSAVADIVLDNFDGGLNISSGRSFLARPLKLYGGVEGDVLPIFTGLTKGIPKYESKIATWTAMDFLSEIGKIGLPKSLKLRDVRTDEVIAAILKQYGMDESQFFLNEGQNVIPFVSFEKGEKSGDILRKLVMVENGALWLDENGIIRFMTRAGKLGAGVDYAIDNDNIIDIRPSQVDNIINRVVIESEVRRVQPRQVIFSGDFSEDDDSWQIDAGGSKSVWLNLSDPVMTIEPLALGYLRGSRFVARNMNTGSDVIFGVDVKGELLGQSYKVTFRNDNNFKIRIEKLELWGEPAKVVENIRYEAKDQQSIEKFGDRTLEIIDNNFFGNQQNCDSFAEDILRKMSDFSPILEVDVRIDPSLQLSDVVSIEGGDFAGDYLIKNIALRFDEGLMSLRLHRHEILTPFILDQSTLDGGHVLS